MRPGRYGPANRPGATSAAGVGARGLVLSAVAVVLGIILLQAFDTGSGQVGPEDVRSGATSTTRRPSSATIVPPPTSRPPRAPGEVTVLPANGTATPGLGGRIGDRLQQGNYDTLDATDATRAVETTSVEYVPDFEPEARAVAQLLGLPATAVKPMSESPPVDDTADADILVLIGPELDRPNSTSTTEP